MIFSGHRFIDIIDKSMRLSVILGTSDQCFVICLFFLKLYVVIEVEFISTDQNADLCFVNST